MQHKVAILATLAILTLLQSLRPSPTRSRGIAGSPVVVIVAALAAFPRALVFLFLLVILLGSLAGSLPSTSPLVFVIVVAVVRVVGPAAAGEAAGCIAHLLQQADIPHEGDQ